MQEFIITGGHRLSGELTLQGSKNSSLPIMAAALLGGGETVLKNCPELTDEELREFRPVNPELRLNPEFFRPEKADKAGG